MCETQSKMHWTLTTQNADGTENRITGSCTTSQRDCDYLVALRDGLIDRGYPSKLAVTREFEVTL